MLIETFVDDEDDIDRFGYLHYHSQQMTNESEKRSLLYTLNKIIHNIENVDHSRILLVSSMKWTMMLELKKLNEIINSEGFFSKQFVNSNRLKNLSTILFLKYPLTLMMITNCFM